MEKLKEDNRLPKKIGYGMLDNLDKVIEQAQDLLQDLEKDGEMGHDWSEASDNLLILESAKDYLEDNFSKIFKVLTEEERNRMKKRVSNLRDELDYGELYLDELNNEEEEDHLEIDIVNDLCNTLERQIDRLEKELERDLERE